MTRPARPFLTAFVAAGFAATLLFDAPGVLAQSGQEAGGRNALRVAPVILAEPEVETQLGIQVAGMDGAPPQTFVRIKGLPLAAKLSDGHVVMPGVWAVPLTAVGNLRVLAPLATLDGPRSRSRWSVWTAACCRKFVRRWWWHRLGCSARPVRGRRSPSPRRRRPHPSSSGRLQ